MSGKKKKKKDTISIAQLKRLTIRKVLTKRVKSRKRLKYDFHSEFFPITGILIKSNER